MATPELTPVNCAGDTCSVRLGRDLESANPSALRGEVLHDDTLDCDESGLHVARCNPAENLDPAQIPVDLDNANLLRKVEQCGLIVLAPVVKDEGAGVQRDIPDDGNTSTSSKQYQYTNQDTVDHLVTLTARVWVRGQKINADNISCLLRAAYRVVSNIASMEAATTVDTHLTLTFDDAENQVLDDRRYLHQMWKVPPGVTLTVNYYLDVINRLSFSGDNADSRGFQVVRLVSRIEQMRSS